MAHPPFLSVSEAEGLGTGEIVGIAAAAVIGVGAIGAAAMMGFKKHKAGGGGMPELPCASKPGGGAPTAQKQRPAPKAPPRERGAPPAKPGSRP